MNEASESQVCERADDLISFLYGELSDREARSFEQHRQSCRRCESELAAFGQVRQSVQSWRNESLGLSIATVRQTVQPAETKRSAWAAIRAFFEISPVWMKGAAAFAAMVFCVLAALAGARLFEEPQLPTVSLPSHTDDEFRIAVASQAEILARTGIGEATQAPVPSGQRAEQNRAVNNNVGDSSTVAQVPRKTKPLSRSERNQLAVDLRLISDEIDDEDSLQLLGDRINR